MWSSLSIKKAIIIISLTKYVLIQLPFDLVLNHRKLSDQMKENREKKSGNESQRYFILRKPDSHIFTYILQTATMNLSLLLML